MVFVATTSSFFSITTAEAVAAMVVSLSTVDDDNDVVDVDVNDEEQPYLLIG